MNQRSNKSLTGSLKKYKTVILILFIPAVLIFALLGFVAVMYLSYTPIEVIFSELTKQCAPLEIRKLASPNPVSYEFPYPMDYSRQKVLEAFSLDRMIGDKYYEQLGFQSAETPSSSRMVYFHPFSNPAHINDIHLQAFGETFSSQTYFALKKPLEYRAEFYIHLSPKGNGATVITIRTERPRVLKGLSCCGPHGFYAREVSVEPTSIEEYKLLLYIGHYLGIQEMQALQLPKHQ